MLSACSPEPQQTTITPHLPAGMSRQYQVDTTVTLQPGSLLESTHQWQQLNRYWVTQQQKQAQLHAGSQYLQASWGSHQQLNNRHQQQFPQFSQLFRNGFAWQQQLTDGALRTDLPLPHSAVSKTWRSQTGVSFAQMFPPPLLTGPVAAKPEQLTTLVMPDRTVLAVHVLSRTPRHLKLLLSPPPTAGAQPPQTAMTMNVERKTGWLAAGARILNRHAISPQKGVQAVNQRQVWTHQQPDSARQATAQPHQQRAAHLTSADGELRKHDAQATITLRYPLPTSGQQTDGEYSLVRPKWLNAQHHHIELAGAFTTEVERTRDALLFTFRSIGWQNELPQNWDDVAALEADIVFQPYARHALTIETGSRPVVLNRGDAQVHLIPLPKQGRYQLQAYNGRDSSWQLPPQANKDWQQQPLAMAVLDPSLTWLTTKDDLALWRGLHAQGWQLQWRGENHPQPLHMQLRRATGKAIKRRITFMNEQAQNPQFFAPRQQSLPQYLATANRQQLPPQGKLQHLLLQNWPPIYASHCQREVRLAQQPQRHFQWQPHPSDQAPGRWQLTDQEGDPVLLYGTNVELTVHCPGQVSWQTLPHRALDQTPWFVDVRQLPEFSKSWSVRDFYGHYRLLDALGTPLALAEPTSLSQPVKRLLHNGHQLLVAGSVARIEHSQVSGTPQVKTWQLYYPDHDQFGGQ